MKTKSSPLAIIFMFCMAIQSQCAAVIFNDGQVHTIDYVVAGSVDVYDGPGPPLPDVTTVNLVDGGYIGDSLELYENSCAYVRGGTVGEDTELYGNSRLHVSGGKLTEDLELLNNSLAIITGGLIMDFIETFDHSRVIMFGGFLGLGLRPVDSGRITLYGTDFTIDGAPVGYGPIPASDGILSGTLAGGDTINDILFNIGPGACVVLAPKPATIIYVDANAPGLNNGSSWTDAYNFLQDALTAASYHPDVNEIRVAQGTYKPDQGTGITPGDRTATFQLINGLTLKGGYAGSGQPDPNVRDFVAYETILSGDIGTVADFSDNSYHIVQGGDNAILEGFTAVGGNANRLFQSSYGLGGGLYNDNCRIVVANCTFEKNAALNGGAIFSAGGTLAVYESIFVANLASQGGALVNLNGHMTLTRCVLRNNAEGTIFCFGNAAIQVERCVFENNYGGWHAIDCSSTGNVLEVINSLFTHNNGGAINSSYNSLFIVNSTLVDNHTTTFGGGVCCSYGSLSAANCIMWGNTAEWGGDEIFGADASMTVSYSCIAGGHPGAGNINTNPLFRAPASKDYHLLVGSSCIDSGDNSAIPPRVKTDLDGNPRIADGDADGNPVVDMGAYEAAPYVACCFGVNHLKIETKPLKPAKCKGIALLEVTSDQGVFVYEPKPGKEQLKANTIVDDGVNGEQKIHTSGSEPLDIGDVFGAYTVTNLVKIMDERPTKNGHEVDVKATFAPVAPVDLSVDDVAFIIDDGEGNVLEVFIPAGSFKPDGPPETQRFKYDAPKKAKSEIKAKFDFAKCRFQLQARKLTGADNINGTTLGVALYVGNNIGEELVEVKTKGKHLEHKKKRKVDCCSPAP